MRSPANDAERRAYEQDCLAHVRYWFDSAPRDDRHDVREVWLESSHPDTKINVRWFDLFNECEYVQWYPVWWSIFTAPDGGVEAPSQVAMLIHTWVHESQPKPPT